MSPGRALYNCKRRGYRKGASTADSKTEMDGESHPAHVGLALDQTLPVAAQVFSLLKLQIPII
jgi:hypothetical protein